MSAPERFAEDGDLAFAKYHGAGNDFVLVRYDRAGPHFRDLGAFVRAVCDRHTGIGADGLILWTVETNARPRMAYRNADGAPSSFCGNGARCFVRCLADELGGSLAGEPFTFVANDGEHIGQLMPDGRVRVSMHVKGAVTRHSDEADLVDTGSPHYVTWCGALPDGDIAAAARAIRYAEPFAREGVNVNYAAAGQRGAPAQLAVRTYERGVEAETLACGTGVTAVALSFAERRGLTGELDIPVRAVGGDLRVAFRRLADGSIADVTLTGPAVRVFAGVWPGSA